MTESTFLELKNLREDIISKEADLSTFTDEEKKIRRRIQKRIAQETYRKKHPEKIKDINKNWHFSHYKEYRKKNIEKIRSQDRKYKKEEYARDPEKFRKRRIEYRKKDPEKYKRLSRESYQRNRENNVRRSVENVRKKLKTDPVFKMEHRLRTRMWLAVKGKRDSKCIRNYVGCDINKLKEHLESQFTEGMSWNNYGYRGWHIDHIKPCASFDLSNDSEVKECFHYSNLQPLWFKDNLTKGSRL